MGIWQEKEVMVSVVKLSGHTVIKVQAVVFVTVTLDIMATALDGTVEVGIL